MVHIARDESIEFVLRPVLGEERRREHHDAEPTADEPFVDLAPEHIADLEFELVIPDREVLLAQRKGERPHDLLLVVECMADKHVVRLGFRRRCLIAVHIGVVVGRLADRCEW